MALNFNQTYRVLNYCSSPISVSTKNESVLINGGSESDPGVWNFTIDEIRQINNTSKVFKVGHLWFDEDVAEDMYKELKIFDYENILTDAQIEDMLCNPTDETIATLLEIKEKAYYDRIYGIFIGLRNAGYPISMVLDSILRERYKELMFGRTTTQIPYKTPKETEAEQQEQARIKDLERKVEILAAALESKTNESTDVGDVVEKKQSAPKPKTKTTRKTTKTSDKAAK